MTRQLLLGLAFLALAPATARAADAIAPRDGETVPSRPTFAFDFTNGAVTVEVSRSPDVRTAGDNAGSFVDPLESDFSLLYMREPRDGLAPWSGHPLAAGPYYWHAEMRDDDSRSEETWSPVRTMTVRDEPIVFEGWTLEARRLRARRGCRSPVRVSGTIAWSDNARTPTATYAIRLDAGSRTVARIRGAFAGFGSDFGRVLCLRHRRLTAVASLQDPGGHRTVSPPRPLVVGA